MIDEELKTLIGSTLKDIFGGLVSKKESTYTLYSWLDYWYSAFKERHIPPLSKNGLYQIRNCIDKHIKSHLQDKPLGNVTAADCYAVISSITSPRMAVYAYDTLNDSLDRAAAVGEIAKNPMIGIDKPRHKREKKLPLTREQEYYFKKYIRGNKLENLFNFYLASGVRKSEALVIKWSDVDYAGKRIFVAGTKTKTSRRYIPLFDSLQAILKKQPHTSEYIFPYADYTVKNTWRWLCKKHEDITYTIHSLRHTFATRCYENGIADKIIQKWLGHSKVTTTQNIYIDVLEDFENAAIEQMNTVKNRLLKKR